MENKRLLKTYAKSHKDGTVKVAIDEDRNSFVMQFIRTIKPDESIFEVKHADCTADVRIDGNNVVTSVEITKEAAMLLILNFKDYFNGCD